MAKFMDKKYLTETSIIFKDKIVWEAFLAIITHEEAKIVAKLTDPQEIDNLFRINAEYALLQKLRKLREYALSAERLLLTTEH